MRSAANPGETTNAASPSTKVARPPHRAREIASEAFRLDAVPMAQPVWVDESERGGRLFHTGGAGGSCTARVDRVTTWGVDAALPTILRVGRLWTSESDEGFMWTGVERASVRRAAAWVAFNPATDDGNGVDVVLREGAIPAESLTVRAERAWNVHAMRVAGGALLVFRHCVSGCGDLQTAHRRVEEVDVIGPRALWVSTSGPNQEQASTGPLRFSWASARVEDDSSASMTIVAMPSEGELRSYSLDLLWPRGEDATMLVATSVLDGDATTVAAARAPVYGWETCAGVQF